MTERLTFISPAIIERIENGSFVPARRSHANLKLDERRNVLSPLAVTKRCIRYDPNVFHHRQRFILKMARALNQLEKKILLVGGPQGVGKTSLVRGLIELMGSRNEQLLWFDVNRHTDFEEIIQFLIQYITYICSAMGDEGEGATELAAQDAPIRKLETLINRVADMPLLLVLDNVEYIVDAELRFNSYPFKEMLNFLLAFPNIKMVLIGERLPYADMSPNQDGVLNVQLEGLLEPDAVQFLQTYRKSGRHQELDPAVLEQAATPEGERAAIRQLYGKTQGQPWLLKILFYLNHQANLDFYTLNRLLNSEQDEPKALPVGDFVRYIYQRLPDQHRRVFQVLCFIRHSIDVKSLLALMGVCYPVLGPSGLDRQTLEDILEHSLLKGILKISYPPQEVLAHIRHRHQAEGQQGERRKRYRPWYELYHAVKKILYACLPYEERDRIHGVLQDFYLREKSQEPENRILRLKSRAILAESKYHGSVARERKAAPSSQSAQLMSTEGAEDASLASKVYLSRNASPATNPQRLTLEDYRRVQLPDSVPVELAGAPTASEPVVEHPDFAEMLGQAAGTRSLREQLAELELTEEEKALLSEKEARFGEAFLSPSTASESSVPPEKPEAPAAPVPAVSPEDAARREFDALTLHESSGDEREKQIQQRLAAAVAAQDKPVMVRELVELARYRADHGRLEGAERCLEKALGLKSDANRELLAEIYRLSGSVNKETYHHNAAVASLSKAAVEIRRLMYEDDTVDATWMGRLGRVFQDLGEIYGYRKQYEEAIEAMQQALRWYHSAEDQARQAEVHFQLAGVYDDRNQPEEAIQHYQKALALDEANGNQLSAASSLANLGGLYRDSGALTEAVDCFQRSLQYDRAVQNVDGQLNTLDTLAGMYLGREPGQGSGPDRLQKTETLVRQGLALAIQEGAGVWQASFYMKLGQLNEAQNQWAQALHCFQLAYSSGVQELSQESLEWIQQTISRVKEHHRDYPA